VWECLGTKETGAQTFVVPANENIVRGSDVPVACEEICRSGIESNKPITVTLQPIMAKGGRGQTNPAVLPVGPYRLTLLMLNPSAAGPRSFEVLLGTGQNGQAGVLDRIDIPTGAAANIILMRSYPVQLQSPGRMEVVLRPIVGKAILCGAVLEPLPEGDNAK
jgi:hypothetical protein